MKPLSLFLLLLIAGCVTKMEKPFVIIDKRPCSDHQGGWSYEYQDRYNNHQTFRDYREYFIGDTIR